MRLALFIAAALAPFATLAQPPAGDTEKAVALVNRHRAAYGLPRVKGDAVLARAAAWQTAAMVRAQAMSHAAGGAFGERLRAAGVRGVAAENLGHGYRSIAEAVEGWKSSAGHNANLLNPQVARIGVSGAAGVDGRFYWTMILAQ